MYAHEIGRMLALPYGADETRPGSSRPVPGQERREVRRDADRAHARSPAAVRDRERLVQVQMADVGPDVAGSRQADLGVHVRAVHVDLAAGLVDEAADLDDRLLEHAVRARVGDHQGPEVRGVGRDLGPEVVEVDVAVRVGGHDDHPVAGHDRARGVRAVGRGRDQADLAMALAARPVPAADREEARVLALRAGVRLEADRRRSR